MYDSRIVYGPSHKKFAYPDLEWPLYFCPLPTGQLSYFLCFCYRGAFGITVYLPVYTSVSDL